MLKQFGSDLRKLREIKGITLTEVSAETRINVKFLSNIENGVFDFQPETYVRSFIKAYARAIGENENQIINDYDKAKAGFYTPRKFSALPESENITENQSDTAYNNTEDNRQAIISEIINNGSGGKNIQNKSETEAEVSRVNRIKKVMVVIIIISLISGIYFLWQYLSDPPDNKSEIKPKTFSEISESYESKLTGRKDSVVNTGTGQKNLTDSIMLAIKSLKEVRVKIYIDESNLFEEELKAKDSVVLKAGEKFRFSASSADAVQLYLNGTFIRKPAKYSGSSIKNLIINKDGILP
jgi:cytoskeletal protein RodZ